MSTEFMLELYGYIGSVLVVVSLLMASVVKLRIFNTLGCIVSGSYALIIGSLPLCLMNGALIFINAYRYADSYAADGNSKYQKWQFGF